MLNNEERLRKNQAFYLINKNLWEFFRGIYGGGPTIIINDDSS